MDLYLPADFYRLRDELNDWRDAPSASPDRSHWTERSPTASDAELRNDCADPSWKVF